MKNTTRNTTTNKNMTKLEALKKLMTVKQFKFTSRRFLSAFFIYALVFVPLLTTDLAVRQAQAQAQPTGTTGITVISGSTTISGNLTIIGDLNFPTDPPPPVTYLTLGNTTLLCGNDRNDPDEVVQKCLLGGGAIEDAVKNQALDDVLKTYGLPDTAAERLRVKRYARAEYRAALFTRLLAFLRKPNPTSDEQAAIDVFVRRIKAKRVAVATAAQSEYNLWKQKACNGYTPPSPYTYDPGTGCFRSALNFFSPKAPSFEEFQQFGAAKVYSDVFTAQNQKITAEAAAALATSVGIGAAVVAGAVGAAIGSTITFGTLSAVLPFAGITFVPTAVPIVVGVSGGIGFVPTGATFTTAVLPAAGASSGAVGASAVAGPAAIFILALTAAVVVGLRVSDESQLPGKLQDAIDKAKNDNYNQFNFNSDTAAVQELFASYFETTLPDYDHAGDPVPPASADTRGFNKTDSGSGSVTLSPTLDYVDWDGKCHSARLSGGWFVDKNLSSGVEKQILSINYINEAGIRMIASRKDAQFVLTAPHDLTKGKSSDSISYLDCAGKAFRSNIEAGELELLPLPKIVVNCPGDFSTVVLGTVRGKNFNPADLRVTLNGASRANVNGVNLDNFSVNQSNQIAARLYFDANAPIPATGEVNITVSKVNSGLTASSKFTLERTALQDFFKGNTNLAVRVGDSFTQDYEQYTGQPSNACFTSTTTIIGEPPAGITLNNTPGNISASGTLTSGGKYVFALQKTYTNGEILKRIYTVNVVSELTAIPSGLTSWWRAENNHEDFTGAHNGTLATRINPDPLNIAKPYDNFADGKVGRGFRFDGSDNYVRLPGDTFDSSRSFTFETWFKTVKGGTILGQQADGVQPYNDVAVGKTTNAIYVDRAGNLKIQMFKSAQGAQTVANKVNDNRSHHVAVVHFVAPNGQGQSYVYFDGVNTATYDDFQQPVNNPQYQFGTGYYTQTSANDDSTGWKNFNGIIDEPTLYNRNLSQAEIKSIFTSGAAGKIAVEVVANPTLDRTGIIKINVRGGDRGLTYSIDNGATFKNTSEFADLTPKSYNIVVKDGAGRIYRTTVIVPYASPGLNVTARGTNPKCSGATNGTLTIDPGIFTVTGTGTTNVQNIPLLYSLDGGATTQSSNVFTNLAPGNYTPWVKHAPSNTVATGAAVRLINPPPVAISPTNFVNSAAVGSDYSQEFTISNSISPYSITIGQLPPGLFSATDFDSARFRIFGTPTQTGAYQIPITITDGNSCPFSQTLTLTVYDNNCRVVTVQNNNDSGAGSLRQTIIDACPEARVIIPGSIGRITLASQITIDKSLNIEADNPNLNVVSGNNRTRIFETAANTTVNISNFTLTGGNAGDAAAGAIANRGTLGIFNSVLENNRALSGGAIYNIGTVYLNSSSVINNFASGNSGGIFNGNGNTLELRNVTVAGNSTNGAGGGIFNGGTLFVANSTVTGNRSDADGISDANGTGGGGLAASGTETLINNIIAGNLNGATAASTASDIGDAVETAEYNLIGNTATSGGITNGATGNIVGSSGGAGTIPVASILSSTLSLNGGSTPNFALAANSPAIDKGKLYNDVTRFGTSDQRFRLRPVDNPDVPNAAGGNGSDIGSFEVQAAAPANSLNISGRITNGGQGLSNVLVLLSNGKTATTYTDANGNYTFAELPSGGFFDITPTLNGYTFSSPALAYSNVTTSVVNADFITSTVTYEGDIAARPIGNGTVDIFDLVSLGRIIGNFDQKPANGGEFQRTDIAPAASFGDGLINVQDLVQLGRYVGNLDQKTPATGAASYSSASNSAVANMFSADGVGSLAAENLLGNLLKDESNLLKDCSANISSPNAPAVANLSAGSVTATSTNAVVPINLASNADTTAIQFTVNYDPAKLSIPMDATNSAIINRYPNTTFVINNNTPGKLGIVAYQPLDGASVFPNNVKLFDINFSVVSGAAGTTSISFGSDPVPQAASNPQGGNVPVSGTPGTVTFLGPTAASVSLGGRVMVGTRGLVNATVYLTNQGGETRQARTTAFGYYRFAEVAAGETYVISVVSKKYSFSPQVINVTEDSDSLNFIASERNKTETTLSP